MRRSRFGLICDQRRLNLIAIWFKVLNAICRSYLRWRCLLVTWQEISATLSNQLRVRLEAKYGICV